MFALDRDHPLRPALGKSLDNVNRDVVDAERQLRLGVDEDPLEPFPLEEEDSIPED
jgi:hypothetical protein